LYLYDCVTGECFLHSFTLPASPDQVLQVRQPHAGRWKVAVNSAPDPAAGGNFTLDAIVTTGEVRRTPLPHTLGVGERWAEIVAIAAKADHPVLCELIDAAAERDIRDNVWFADVKHAPLMDRPAAGWTLIPIRSAAPRVRARGSSGTAAPCCCVLRVMKPNSCYATALLVLAILGVTIGRPSAQPERPTVQNPAPPKAAGTPLITVGPNVQVSASMPAKMHSEGLILADPTNVKRLLVCSMFREPDMGEGVAVYVSEDGGTGWQRTFESGADDHAGDPACAFGPDGVAYLMMIPLGQRAAGQLHLPLLRSEDGGHTWRTVARTGYLDRESLVVDGTQGRFRNRVYAHGTTNVRGTTGPRRTGIAEYATANGSGPFEAPVERASLGGREIFGMSNSLVLSDGRWLGLFGEIRSSSGGAQLFNVPPEQENMSLEVVASDDGGDSLNQPVTISGWYMPNTFVRLTNVCPMMAADATTGPFKDRVYVVWPDARFGASDILLSYSADRGQTWSAPIVVNDNPRNVPPDKVPNQLLPAVAVNNAGVVAVTWLDRRDDPDNLAWRERVRVSLDGGETFEPSVVVSAAPARFDGTERWPTTASTVGGGTPVYPGALFRLLVFAPIHTYIPGDYAGLTADGEGTFHPYWIDNRTGTHQVWTAAVRIAGKAVKNGSDELASLDDLTQMTTLDRISSGYDPATHVATMTVRLRNMSTKTLRGPFVIRALSLDSDNGDVEALDTSNGKSGAGAVWDLTSKVNGGELRPNASSDPIELRFVLRNVRSTSERHIDRFNLGLVRLYARVLGRTP
jgi:hypothetical protein